MAPEAQGEDAKAGVCLGKPWELRLEDDWRHVQPVERDLGFKAQTMVRVFVFTLSLSDTMVQEIKSRNRVASNPNGKKIISPAVG